MWLSPWQLDALQAHYECRIAHIPEWGILKTRCHSTEHTFNMKTHVRRSFTFSSDEYGGYQWIPIGCRPLVWVLAVWVVVTTLIAMTAPWAGRSICFTGWIDHVTRSLGDGCCRHITLHYITAIQSSVEDTLRYGSWRWRIDRDTATRAI